MWFFSGSSSTTLPAATLALDFGATVPEGITATRSAAALGRDATGRWVSYAGNVLRPWSDPVTLAGPFALVEPERTQVFARTRAPTPTPVQTTLGNDAAVQTPFGLGAVTVTPNTVVAQHGWDAFFGVVSHGAAIGDDSTVALHFVLKPKGLYTNISFFLLNRNGVYSTARFALEGNGSVVSQDKVIAAEISRDTDGFYSVRIVNNYGAGTTTPSCTAGFHNTDGARSFAGDGTSGLWLAYAGAELGAEVTSPIINPGTVAVTRPADIVTSDTSWLATGAKSLGVDYVPLGRSNQTIVHLGGTDSLELQNSAQTVSYLALAAGAQSAAITAPAPPPGTERTAVLTSGTNTFLLAQNGSVLGTDTGGTGPSAFSQLRIGAQTGGLQAGPLLIRRLKYWDQVLPSAAARTYSTNLAQPGDVSTLPVVEIQATLTVQPDENIATLVVMLSGEPSGATVNYRTVDGTAKAGVDYVGTTGTLDIDAGQTTGTIAIGLAVRGPVADRTFTLELTSASGATLGKKTCQVLLLRVIPSGLPASTQTTLGATLPATLTLTRNSVAWTRNSAGIWTQVASGGYRQHFTAPGISGLLIEPAVAEQRLYDSVDPGFTATGGTKTLNTTGSTPTGTRWLAFRESATTGDHGLSVTLTTGNCDMPTTEFTTSVLIRGVNRRYIRFAVKGIDNITDTGHIDLFDAGAVTTTDTGTILTLERDPFATDWYRIALDRPQSVTAGVSAQVTLTVEDASQNSTLAGAIDNGFDLCHIQLEPGAGMTSPILVQGVTAKTTRDRDIVRATGFWYQLATYSLGIRFIRLRTEPSSQYVVMAKDTANATTADDNGLSIEGGILTTRLRTGSVTQPVIAGPAVPLNVPTTVLMTVDAASRIKTYSGGDKIGELAVGGTVASPLAVAALRFGGTEPSGFSPGSMVLQAVYSWTAPLSEPDALLVSGNLNVSPTSGAPPLPVVSLPTALSVLEGQAVTVTLTKTGVGACSVSFATKPQTATSPADYTTVGPVTVTFAASDTTKTVQVQTATDTTIDPSDTFNITLSSPSGCTLGNASGTVTITELPRLSVPTTLSITEGGKANVIITKTGAGACSVTWRTVAGTATLNSDYTGVNATTVSFTATETSKTVSVQTLADALVEASETFNVVLENPTGCTLTTSTCVVTILDATVPPVEVPDQTAYTTAVGFASAADCGTGFPIYRVTNLNDSGTGSLRAGVLAGNCMIIFEVAGRIILASDLIFGSNVTIAGETAPAPGITIQKKEFKIQSNNVRISHITFQKGYDGSNLGNSDVGKVAPGSGTVPATGPITSNNIHFSHCAFYWGMDETVEHFPWYSRRLTNVSYHDCIFTEALYLPKNYDSTLSNHIKVKPTGTQDDHCYGPLISFNVRRIDMQYCLFSEFSMRCPFIDHTTDVVLANNVANNCQNGATIQHNTDPAPQVFSVTCKGYLVISGPNSGTGLYRGFTWFTYKNPLPANSKAYATGIYGWKGGTATSTYQNPGNGVGYRGAKPYYLNGTTQVAVEVSTPPIDTPTATSALTAQEIYDRAVDNVGPRPKEIRDLIDGKTGALGSKDVRRTIDRLKSKTGKWVNHENEVGGFYAPAQVTRKLDGTTKFPSGTTIPAPPSQPQPATATSKAAMRAWLRLHLDQVQSD